MSSDIVSISIRVRYAECDPMQVAHHANYLVWFEAARSEYCRVRGISYAQMERDGFFLPVVEASCRYVAPARYDDLLTLTTWVAELKRRSLRMRYVLRRGETELAHGETYHIVVDGDGRARTWPPDIAARFVPEAPLSP
jgi:acyl-CoA thioester hydrolase